MHIEYRVNQAISSEAFIGLLEASGLSERRPVEDRQCIDGMLSNADILVCAWYKGELIGVARSVSDFHYACYLSDLAVDKRYQNLGIGKQLQTLTQQQLKPTCKLILIAAPAANQYYEKLGFKHNPRCWVLGPEVKR